MRINRSSTGGASESIPDASDEAEEGKSEEGTREDSQAREETAEGKREEGQCGRRESRGRLTRFQRPGNRVANCGSVL